MVVTDTSKQIKEIRKSIARLEYKLNSEINPWQKIKLKKKLTQYEIKRRKLEFKQFREEMMKEIKSIKALKKNR